ncbi:MAG TPA: hypothetical protein VFP07_00030 [Buchnera sp. (in: enterobacteria)]|nr:hypothetical protein [Buchnera sp. (in: enterobacteria)]
MKNIIFFIKKYLLSKMNSNEKKTHLIIMLILSIVILVTTFICLKNSERKNSILENKNLSNNQYEKIIKNSDIKKKNMK